MAVIDHITDEPNIVTFNGRDYDLQLGFYATKEIYKRFAGGIAEAMSKFESLDVVFDCLAILMNATIVKENFEQDRNDKLLTGEYLATVLPLDAELLKKFGKAFGLDILENKEEDDLDKKLDELGVENPKKSEAEEK